MHQLLKGIHGQKTSKNFMDAYERFADAIYKYCYFRLSSKEQAEEITQETFLHTWQYLLDGGRILNIRPFLYKTAHNLVVNEYARRSRKKESSLEDLHEQGFDLPDGQIAYKQVEDRMECRRMLKLLDSFDPAYQEVMTMRYIDDLSPKEIALICNETENTISIRLHRGLKKIRSALTKHSQPDQAFKSIAQILTQSG